MPGMAEPDIALDIVSTATSLSAADPIHAHRLAPRPRLALRAIGLIGLDAFVAASAAMLSYALFDSPSSLTIGPVMLPIVCLTICTILSFAERGLYAPFEIVSHTVPWRKLVLAWLQAVAVGTLAVFCLGAIAGPVHLPAVGRMTETLQGPWLPVFLALGLSGVIAGRLLRQRLHAGPAPLNRTVIIGEAASIADLVLRIRAGAPRSFDVIGLVSHADTSELGSRDTYLGLPLFGDIDALERMIRQDAVDTVLVALPWTEADRIRAIIHRISMAPVDVYVYPGLNVLNLPLRRAERSLDNLPLLVACNRPIDGWRGFVKRAEDVVLSAGVLLFISPVMLAIAVAIKLTSKGPVFFKQRRLGYNNRVIEVLKFRSMYTHLADADATLQAFRGDKRVTKVGAWLRKTSMDELPQLLNVLRGDMSLVGPRPHALATTAGGMALEEAVPVYASRHRVKPGITGWAQVHGYRGALDTVDKIVHRVNHDLYYIENWSLALDLKILWRTARLVFADDNAF
ncbi:MAG: undecaprenyl-phosphate glucose phosphotransferase [Rhodospirillales bacterium 20-64-7]|nr:MAG: undecaprenyl-phosphate glucose phosphotransferase [Rhodospirillales bacterium 20-64-7]HQT76004.1 undecaprenyl-phosphate glucose phosphotransferase [Rhodopila sp.]